MLWPRSYVVGIIGHRVDSEWLCVHAVNYLLLEALDTYAVLCDDLMTSTVTSLSAAAADIRRRLAAIFLLDASAQRPLHAGLRFTITLLVLSCLFWACCDVERAQNKF